MPLQSNLLRGDSRLEEVAGGGRPVRELPQVESAETVKRLQKSLVALGQGQFFTSKSFPNGLQGEPDGRYGAETFNAVMAFQKRAFPNDPSQWDGRVGKLTLPEMDRRLPGGNGPPPPPPGPAPPRPFPVTVKPLDIFILFSGTPPGATPGSRDTGAEQDFDRTFNTSAYLNTHQRGKSICFFGGRDAEDRSAAAVKEAQEARASAQAGATVVLGVSAGGFAALKAASLLTARNIPIDYVAINDGAFFQAEGDITSFDPLNIRLPGNIVANRKENFFQTFGHNLLKDSRGPGGFMLGTEFHGQLAGFRNVNMVGSGPMLAVIAEFSAVPGSAFLPLAIKKKFASRAHVAAVKAADPSIDRVIKELIKP